MDNKTEDRQMDTLPVTTDYELECSWQDEVDGMHITISLDKDTWAWEARATGSGGEAYAGWSTVSPQRAIDDLLSAMRDNLRQYLRGSWGFTPSNKPGPNAAATALRDIIA